VAEILNPHNVDRHFDNVLDTAYVYEYDSYTLENYKDVKVEKLDYTNKFYTTDSSLVYLKYDDNDTVEFVEINFDQNVKNEKTLKNYLHCFKNIDLEDLKVRFVYSNYKFIGLDVNGVLYSLVKLDIDKTGINTFVSPKLSVLQQKNKYDVYTLNGKLVLRGNDLTALNQINTESVSAGVYVVHIMGTQYSVTTTHIVK
jgi:hypothetical protein